MFEEIVVLALTEELFKPEEKLGETEEEESKEVQVLRELDKLEGVEEIGGIE